MTLPKAISDAIDAYRDGHAEVVASVALKQQAESVAIACRASNSARAALERAIADHVSPVDAPNEAQIEAWSGRLNKWLLRQQACIRHPNGESLVSILRHGQGLMRRFTAATPAPSALERLRDKIRSEADNADESYSAGLHRAADMIEDEREAGHG
jgi:hypothetical protein